jgi:hypothetical protein
VIYLAFNLLSINGRDCNTMTKGMRAAGFFVRDLLVLLVLLSCLVTLVFLLSSVGRGANDKSGNWRITPTAVCLEPGRDVLFGIFTTAGKVETRRAIRAQSKVCGLNGKTHATVFVLGRARSRREQADLLKEHAEHGDILELSVEENMNEGKSYHYFREVLERLPCFEYFAKVDDDTAFAPERLAARVRQEGGRGEARRQESILLGRRAPNNDRSFHSLLLKSLLSAFRDVSWVMQVENYTAGMLYVLNTPAVRAWVALNPTELHGDEDFRTTHFMGQVRMCGSSVHNLSLFLSG